MPDIVNKIHKFWEAKAVSAPAGRLVTHRDAYQVLLENKTVCALLKRSDRLLDIGCGNGYATSIYARHCSRVVGIDYSQEMIEAAVKKYKKKNLSFQTADMLSFSCRKGEFSTVLSTRCLINLADWQRQKQAIANIAGILKIGQRFIMIEGMRQGRDRLNGLRVEMGLKPMPKVWHNNDLDETRLMPLLKKFFIIKQDIRFGLYDVLTRVFLPSLVYPKEPIYNTRFHEVAQRLSPRTDGSAFSVYSREACFLLIRK